MKEKETKEHFSELYIGRTDSLGVLLKKVYIAFVEEYGDERANEVLKIAFPEEFDNK